MADKKTTLEDFSQAYLDFKADQSSLTGLPIGEKQKDELALRFERANKEKDWQEQSKMLYELAGAVKQELSWYIGRDLLGSQLPAAFDKEDKYQLYISKGMKALDDVINGRN